MSSVLRGAAALALAASLAGCECGTKFLIPVDAEEGAKLRSQAQGGDLPPSLCDELCIPRGGRTPDGGLHPQSATEAGFRVRYCHVVQDEETPAVFCEGLFADQCM